MPRQARQLAGIGASDLPNQAAVDAYKGPPREIVVGAKTLHIQDGTTPGGIRLASSFDLVSLNVSRETIPLTIIPILRFRDVIGAPWKRGTSTGPGAVRDAAGTWWEIDPTDTIRPEWLGAGKTDGTNEDATIWAAAFKLAMQRGLVMEFAGRDYNFGDLVSVPRADPITPNGFVMRGKGQGRTRFVTSSREGWLRIGTFDETSLAQSAFLSASGFTVIGPNGEKWPGTSGADLVGKGVALSGFAWSDFSNINVRGFGVGLDLAAVLTSVLTNVTLRGNAQGFTARPTEASCPNAITFINASIGSNRDFGGTITRASTFTMIGGSVEGNGIGALAGYGLKFIDCGQQGSAGIDLVGVYFEHNKGDADVYIQHNAYACAYAFRSCNFCRLHSTEYVKNNIKLAASGQKCRVSVDGACAFFHPPTAGYTPDASRPYIDATGSSGDWSIEPAPGVLFVAALETPTRRALGSRSDMREIAAAAYFNGTAGGAVELSPTLNGTLSRAGVGTYVLSFTKALARTDYRVMVTAEASNFTYKVIERNRSYVIIETIQNGADADVAGVSVEVIGGAPY